MPLDQRDCMVHSAAWPAGALWPAAHPLRLQLWACASAGLRQRLGGWSFLSPAVAPEAVEVDLRTLDMYSVHLRSAGRVQLARHFEPGSEPPVGDSVELTVSAVHPAGWPYDLCLDRWRLSDPALLRKVSPTTAPVIEWFFVELTNRCNYRCSWCPEARMKRPFGSMPLERAKGLLREIAAYQRRHPQFSFYAEIRNPIFLHTMGEPLLYPHLLETLEYGHSLDLSFCLITNASMLGGEMTARLLASGLQSITFSLNAPDSETYRQTNSEFHYDAIVAHVRDFINRRYAAGRDLPRIEIQLLNTRNVDVAGCRLTSRDSEVQGQLAFWASCVREAERAAGAEPFRRDPGEAARWPVALESADNDSGTYFAVGKNIWVVFKRACNFANALLSPGSDVQPASHGQCRYRCPYRMLAVFWDGSCSFCTLDYENEINLGNVFRDDIEKIWSADRMRRIRRLMDVGIPAERLCRQCLGAVTSQGRGVAPAR